MRWKLYPYKIIVTFFQWKNKFEICSFQKRLIERRKPKASSRTMQISITIDWRTKYNSSIFKIIVRFRQANFRVNKHIFNFLMQIKRNVHDSIVNMIIRCWDIVKAVFAIEWKLRPIDECWWLGKNRWELYTCYCRILLPVTTYRKIQQWTEYIKKRYHNWRCWIEAWEWVKFETKQFICNDIDVINNSFPASIQYNFRAKFRISWEDCR